MRIIQTIDRLNTGGAERMCINIAHAFNEHDIINAVVTTRTPGTLHHTLNPQTVFFNANKKNAFDLAAFLRFKKFVTSFNPDIIHAHSTSIYWVCLLKLFLPRIKIIWHDHFGLGEHQGISGRNEMIPFSFFIDAIIPVNAILEQWAINKLAVRRDKIILLNNFPSLPNMNMTSAPLDHLLCLANFRAQKNQMNLLSALKLLKSKSIQPKLILAGSIGEPDWYQSCLNFVKEEHLEDQVEFKTDITDVAPLLQQCGTGILSSDSEGLPVSLLEYGAAGLAVICTDAGQCKEALGDGEFGELIETRNILQLADAIQQVIDHDKIAKAKALKFHEFIMENYTGHAFMRKYLPLAQSLSNE